MIGHLDHHVGHLASPHDELVLGAFDLVQASFLQLQAAIGVAGQGAAAVGQKVGRWRGHPLAQRTQDLEAFAHYLAASAAFGHVDLGPAAGRDFQPFQFTGPGCFGCHLGGALDDLQVGFVLLLHLQQFQLLGRAPLLGQSFLLGPPGFLGAADLFDLCFYLGGHQL